MRGNKCLDVSSSDEDERTLNHLAKSSAASRPASNAAANIPSSTSNEGPRSHGRVRKKLPGAEANTKLKKKQALSKDASQLSTISDSKTPEGARKAPNGIKLEQGVFSTTKVKTEPKLETPVKQEVKKERVVYDLPGQTKPTPLESDPLRRFYTSFLEEKSDSKMARKWCIQHGLLSKEEAEEWCQSNGKAPRSISKSTPKPRQPRVKKVTKLRKPNPAQRKKRGREEEES